MHTKDRPLSPHLQVYRMHLSMVLSFSHRATGVALFAGMLVFVYWLVAAAIGPEAYATARVVLGSWIGQFCLFGWTIALFYHLFNGIRHLVWDLGYAFEISEINWTCWAVLVATGGCTVLAWVVAYAVMGGG